MNKILVVDDDEVTRHLLREVLVKEGFQVFLAASGEAAVESLATQSFAIVLSDIRMLELGGMDVLHAAKNSDSRTIVILMTGFGSMDGAIEAIREGAFDYISKPFKINDLKAVLSRASKQWDSLQGRTAQTPPAKVGVETQALMIGRSPRIVEIYKTVARAALSSSHILLDGEPGTGKELVARAIHDNSSRRGKSFVMISCGALAEAQLDRELFGDNSLSGRFLDASGGTLYLDEVGSLPLSVQVKLQRALDDGASSKDVRVIAATHQDLESLVKSAKFREDLYYRLRVIVISMPPLRTRMEDLPDLVEYFLVRFNQRNKKSISHVSEEAMQVLRSYDWPGNIRELESAIESAVALSNTSILFPDDFPSEIREAVAQLGGGIAASAGVLPAADSRANSGSLEDLERVHILKVLQESGYNKSKAAERLGIDRATLYRKAQRYGIDLRGK